MRHINESEWRTKLKFGNITPSTPTPAPPSADDTHPMRTRPQLRHSMRRRPKRHEQSVHTTMAAMDQPDTRLKLREARIRSAKLGCEVRS